MQSRSSRSSFSYSIHFMMVRPWRNLLLMFYIAYSGVLLLFVFCLLHARILLLKFVHCMWVAPRTLLALLLFPLHAYFTLHNCFSAVFWILCGSDLVKSCFFHFNSYCIVIHFRVLTLISYYECSIWLGNPPLCVFTLIYLDWWRWKGIKSSF